jgi:hypothetical protein
VSAVGLLVVFYDIPGRKGEVVFYSPVPDTTQNTHLQIHAHFTNTDNNGMNKVGVQFVKELLT